MVLIRVGGIELNLSREVGSGIGFLEHVLWRHLQRNHETLAVVVVVVAAAAAVVVLRWYWTDLRIAKVFLHVSVVDTARQCFLIVAISHDILPSFANNNASASILAACAHHKNCLYGPH